MSGSSNQAKPDQSEQQKRPTKRYPSLTEIIEAKTKSKNHDCRGTREKYEASVCWNTKTP